MTKGYYVTFRNSSETRIQVIPGSLCLKMWPLEVRGYTVRKTSKPHRKDPEERNGPQLSSLLIWIAMLLAICGSHPATDLSALSWCVLRDTEQNWGKVSCLSPVQITNVMLLFAVDFGRQVPKLTSHTKGTNEKRVCQSVSQWQVTTHWQVTAKVNLACSVMPLLLWEGKSFGFDVSCIHW